MSEDLSFFDQTPLQSIDFENGEAFVEDHYNRLNQHGANPSIPNVSYQVYLEDIPQKSIETDFMESNNHNSMFVTPEPEETGPLLPLLLSTNRVSEAIYPALCRRQRSPDDDCIIVEESDCSEYSRHIWSSSKLKPKAAVETVVIKTEPGLSGAGRPANLMELQKRLILQHNASRKHKKVASTVPGTRPSRPMRPSPSISKKPRPRCGNIYQPRSLENVINVKEEFEAAMRRGEDDNDWTGQHDELDEEEENEEYESMRRLRSTLEERKKAGYLTGAEIVDMMKLDQQIGLHEKRREAAKRHNQRDAISVSSDDVNAMGESHRRQRQYNQEDEDDLIAQMTENHLVQEVEGMEGVQGVDKMPKSKGTRKSKKPRRKSAKNAREVENNRRERQREKERKKQARAAVSKGAPLKAKRSKKVSQGMSQEDKRPYRSHMKFARNKGQESLQTLLKDLVNSDFIADRLAQEELPDAPDIIETRKDKALHALLASVPNDYDTHRAKAEKSDLNKASKHFGHGRVKFVDGSWKVKGMKSQLYHHQLLGADWMLTRELGEIGPFGGLLADSMGLGKTLQTLATMIGNPPTKEDVKANTKSTLIVLPASAIRQWEDEIQVHVEDGIFPRILQYRAKSRIPKSVLQECDIVLTSYAEVMASFPYPSAEDTKMFSRAGGYAKWTDKCKELAGPLHKMSWYRIILDEAHAIKNFKSRTSLACQNLRGKYRWALSGTPIQNRLDELFPYLRFLRTEWTKDYNQFKTYFCDPDAKDANARINIILSIVMMRRTMKDQILGRPIVELPPVHPETQYISFSREEKVLYRILEDRYRDNLNKHFAKGTAEGNYPTFMVQILRLRQCTAHPFLLESVVKEAFTFEDVYRLKEEWRRLGRSKQPMYEQINQWAQQSEAERLIAIENGEAALEPGEKQPFGRSAFGKLFSMGKMLENLNISNLKQRVVCTLCGDLPTDALITECYHIFCKTCLENYIAAEASKDIENEHYQCPEPHCRRIFRQAVSYDELSLQDDVASTNKGIHSKSSKSSQRHENRDDENESDSETTWLETVQASEDKYLPPSAKTIALKAKILNWLDESPNDKIIIFTHWRVMAKIISLICEKEDWNYCYFMGNMTLDARHRSVRKFYDNPNTKIMIAGLKCGGQALNLTCANRVISMDLWWNHSVEQQAFGRVFRIGQHKETYVSRLVVKNTIDMRLLSMQADKMNTIDWAMHDTDTAVVEPLSMVELASLFGHLREKDDGTLQVERDYEEEEEEGEEEDNDSRASEGGEEPHIFVY